MSLLDPTFSPAVKTDCIPEFTSEVSSGYPYFNPLLDTKF